MDKEFVSNGIRVLRGQQPGGGVHIITPDEGVDRMGERGHVTDGDRPLVRVTSYGLTEEPPCQAVFTARFPSSVHTALPALRECNSLSTAPRHGPDYPPVTLTCGDGLSGRPLTSGYARRRLLDRVVSLQLVAGTTKVPSAAPVLGRACST